MRYIKKTSILTLILLLALIIIVRCDAIKKASAEEMKPAEAIEPVQFDPNIKVESEPVTKAAKEITPVVEIVEEVTSESEPETTPQPWTEEEVTVLTKMLWGEARGVPSDTENAACVWCVLNRVDAGMGSIVEVVTKPYQFIGYQEDNPIDDELITLCIDVLTRWYAEKDGQADVGRVLPTDYLWFSGDGKRNHFRNAYCGGDRWDWSLPSPYES